MESLSSLGNETTLVALTTDAWTEEIQSNVSTQEIPTGDYNTSTFGWELVSTEGTPIPPPSDQEVKVPVVGYPGPVFTAIHVAALTSLSLSTVTVTLLLIYLCGISGSVKDQVKVPVAVNGKGGAPPKKKARLSFWRWNVGERFVVYLGSCDLLQGISHTLDHAYMLYAKDNPPERACALFAFFLHEFVFAQFFVIVTTAVSACSLIVFGRKMSLGRYDWRLFAFGFGIPTIVSVVAVSRGLLGASGAWCFIRYGAPSWLLYTQFVNTFQITSFLLVGVAYGAIWIKIQRTTKLMKGSTTERYQSSAKVMMIFVAVFILQWWTLTLFNIWGLFSNPPPPPVLILAVIFINLGGIYNSIAYTIIRRKLQQQKRQNAVVGHDEHTTNTTNTIKTTNTTGAKPPPGPAPRAVSAPSPVDVPGGSDVQDVPSNVPDDASYESEATQSWNIPIIQDAGVVEKQDSGPIQINVHI